MRGLEEAKEQKSARTPIGSFHEIADTFKLDVELFDGSIILSLQDYVGWAHYSRQYTDQDVGGQIHKKMDISELFVSFSQTQNKSDDETLMQNKEKGIFTNIQKYIFGNIIKNGEYPCYKIEKGGKITAYMSLMHSGLKKQITYESILQLDKVKSMTQMEIFVQTSSRQKRELSEQFSRELEIMKKQKATYLSKIEKLEQQNKKIRTELTNYIKKVEDDQRKGKEQIMKQVKDQIKKQITGSLTNQTKQINDLKNSTTNDRNSTTQRFTSLQSQLKSQIKNQVTTSASKFTSYYVMESLPQLFAGKFKIQGYQCILNTAQGTWTQFMFNKFIPYNENFVFKIKVTKSAGKAFMIGVIDYQQRKDQRSSYNSGHAVCYYSAGNCKYPSGAGQGTGFVQGEIIEVTVNRAAKTIKWCVNGTQRALENTFAALGQQARMFVPFIQMTNANQSLEWVP